MWHTKVISLGVKILWTQISATVKLLDTPPKRYSKKHIKEIRHNPKVRTERQNISSSQASYAAEIMVNLNKRESRHVWNITHSQLPKIII